MHCCTGFPGFAGVRALDMATENASSAARYVTLRDYLRVIRRYVLLILLLGAVGAAAGLIDASRQSPVYQATAEVGFQDPTQDLGVVGFGSGTAQTPGQLAAVNASTATNPDVMAAVQRKLRSPYTPDELAGAVSASVDTSSGLLLISAQGPDPVFVTRLANAVAAAVVARDNRQTRAQFVRLANTIQGRIARLTASGARSSGSSSQLGFYQYELPRLQTLAAFAKSAQMASPAQVPSGASSPHRTRSLVLGLLLGLLLGIVVAFVRDSTDRRLRRPTDIRSSFEFPVLGHVRGETLGRVVQLADAPSADSAADLEAFRILRRNLEFLDRDGHPHLVLVTSAVPEEGKTTVASSLALAMAAAGKRTLLVDCDLRRPALAARLGAPPRPGLSEYLLGEADPQEILTTVRLIDPGSRNGNGHATANGNGHGADVANGNGHAADAADAHAAAAANGNGHGAGLARHLVFIPAGTPSRRSAELLGSARFGEFLREVSESYDIVVLDSSPLLPVSDTLEMLPSVDAVILCARAARTTRDQAVAARAALARFPERPTGLVVTGINPRDPEYAAYAYAYDYS